MSRQAQPVSAEQVESLAVALQEAGHEHGDRSAVELVGVGVPNDVDGGAHLAFCPTSVAQHHTLARGSAHERTQPMPKKLTFGRRAERVLGRSLTGFQGFVRFSCDVYSNGTLHVTNVRIKERRHYPGNVRFPGDYETYLESLAPAAT